MPGLGLLKLSVFLMYFNIFWPLRWLRISVYIGSTATTVFYVSFAVVEAVCTTPRDGLSWADWIIGAEEQKSLAALLPTAVVGFLVDLCLLVLPIPALARLHLPTKKKLALSCFFATGML